jgi:creatinine amidohydrolase
MALLSWVEVKAAIEAGTGVILPCGATEQHGPHLPISTDAILGTDLALAVAERVDMLVAPTVSYGGRSRPLSGGGQGFVGTTSLRGTTLIAVVQDVLGELIRHGFKRIVLLSHHMENQGFLYDAAFDAQRVGADGVSIMVMEMPYPEISETTMKAIYPNGFPGWAIEHAAILETSLMLHLHPELVAMSRAVDDAPPRMAWYDLLPIRDEFVAASGSLWKATEGTAEKGELAWREIVEGLASAIEAELPPARR